MTNRTPPSPMEIDPPSPTSPMSPSSPIYTPTSSASTSPRNSPFPSLTTGIDTLNAPFDTPQTSPRTPPSPSPSWEIHTQPRIHPSFHPLLRHLTQPLSPLVSATTGQPHPEFPKTLLSYHLLTHSQLDSLARHYHQVTPPVPATSWYPMQIPVWVDARTGAAREGVDLSTKRRRFGRFIGLRNCESPTEGDGFRERWERREGGDGNEEESSEEMLERMEREWRECLARAREEDAEAALRWKAGGR